MSRNQTESELESETEITEAGPRVSSYIHPIGVGIVESVMSTARTQNVDDIRINAQAIAFNTIMIEQNVAANAEVAIAFEEISSR